MRASIANDIAQYIIRIFLKLSFSRYETVDVGDENDTFFASFFDAVIVEIDIRSIYLFRDLRRVLSWGFIELICCCFNVMGDL